jgi:DNA-binding transcriptional regulator YdaS (Cro superfamily)
VDELLAYLNNLPTAEQRDYAGRCNTTTGYLRKACSAGQKLGADLCIALERESGGAVRCEKMRPDVDWGYLRATTKTASEHNNAAA